MVKVALDFIMKYWTLIIFFGSMLFAIVVYVIVSIESIKCSLRNDILQIYDMCKDEKKITTYQYESILRSSELYFKLKGNSFVSSIVDRIKSWEVID